MNNLEKDELQEYLNRIEMYMPKGWTQKFGEYEKFKELVEKLESRVIDAEESYDDLKESEDTWESKYSGIVNQVQELKDYVSSIEWIDNPEHEEVTASILKKVNRIQ